MKSARKMFHLPVFAAICFAVSLCWPAVASAQNYFLDGAARPFNDNTSWSTGAKPTAGAQAYFKENTTNIVSSDIILGSDYGMSGAQLYAQPGSTTTVTGKVQVRRGDGLLHLGTGASLSFSGALYIDGGMVLDGGTLTQNATSGEFRVCYDPNNTKTSTGVVELKNGATLNAFNLQLNHTSGNGNEVKLIVADSTANISGANFYIGADKGKATVTQSGDSSEVNIASGTNLIIANSAAANGSSYNISGGVLNISGSNFTIGAAGVGAFYQSGDSVVNISGATNFKIATAEAATGSTYYLQGGVLNYATDTKTGGAFNMTSSPATCGYFEHTGGTFNFGSATNKRDMLLENSRSTTDGSRYRISGDTAVLNLSQDLQLARGASFIHENGAEVNVGTDLELGTGGSYPVTYVLSGDDSVLTVSNNLTVQNGGTFTQNGGSVIAKKQLLLGSAVFTGQSVNSLAYELNDGLIHIQSTTGDNNFAIGMGSTAASITSTFTMNGGEIIFEGNRFQMGNENAAKTGGAGNFFNLNGGLFDYQGKQDIALGLKANTNVNFNHTGGTFDIQNGKGIVLNHGAKYTLNEADASNPAVLKAAKIDTTNNAGVFEFLDGTAEIGTFLGDLNQQGGTLHGIMSIDGDYTQAAGATLDLVLTNHGDLLSITGDATLEGLVNLFLSDAFASGMGTDPVTVIDAASISDFGDLLNVYVNGTLASNFTFGWDMGAGLVTLEQHTTPEPATWGMLLAAMAMLGVMRRRRK